MITSEYFTIAVGFQPTQEELDRCNSHDRSDPLVGWNPSSNKPFYMDNSSEFPDIKPRRVFPAVNTFRSSVYPGDDVAVRTKRDGEYFFGELLGYNDDLTMNIILLDGEVDGVKQEDVFLRSDIVQHDWFVTCKLPPIGTDVSVWHHDNKTMAISNARVIGYDHENGMVCLRDNENTMGDQYKTVSYLYKILAPIYIHSLVWIDSVLELDSSRVSQNIHILRKYLLEVYEKTIASPMTEDYNGGLS
tara:strand:+ start:1118 stop:1855 length:738 start_codon:yes stop_codon:yes gene_type:complete